jgi:hypothetical protein
MKLLGILLFYKFVLINYMLTYLVKVHIVISVWYVVWGIFSVVNNTIKMSLVVAVSSHSLSEWLLRSICTQWELILEGFSNHISYGIYLLGNESKIRIDYSGHAHSSHFGWHDGMLAHALDFVRQHVWIKVFISYLMCAILLALGL